MPKTHFENLRVYQLSETLSDHVWEIVLKWDYLARDTVGKQLIRAPTALEQILRKGAVAALTLSTSGS